MLGLDPRISGQKGAFSCTRFSGLRFAPPENDACQFVTFSSQSTSACRSSAAPMVCSGILVPGV